MPSFNLRLEDTYWLKGFFNVPVDYERFVTMDEGPIEIYIGDSTAPLGGRVSRSANMNGTPRIYGNKPLATFFQEECTRGSMVTVEFLSPASLRIAVPQGR